ncbi:hypothetical protein I4U23_028923 [Adineta vaga]|nr:hypothetical protein I4U23_028923 [Adineta vaga]
MTTSIDLSVDELLLLQENQYQLSNCYLSTKVKPIGSERKIGQIVNTSDQFTSQIKPSLIPIQQEYDNNSSNSFETLNNYLSQQQISLLNQQKVHTTFATRIQTGNPLPSFRVPQMSTTNRYFPPNGSPQARSVPSVFTTPFQGTRERFQVNSIGRPILRNNHYNHLLQVHGFKIRR